MNMKASLAALAALGLVLCTSSSQAAIVVGSTFSTIFDPGNPGNDNTGGGGFSINYNVVNPNSVVVVGTYIDGGGGALPTLNLGASAPNGHLSARRTSLSYFLSPATGATTISGATPNAGVSNAGLYVWELLNVDQSAPVASAVSANSANNIDPDVQITTTVAGSFITDVLGFNPFEGNVNANPDANSVITREFFVDANANIGGGPLFGGTATVGPAGTYDLGWDVAITNFGDANNLAFAFAPAVPEPATLVVAGLALVGLSPRRRTA